MTNVKLNFAVILEDTRFDTYADHFGPLFHRWLPNGEVDAILLHVNEPSVCLKVWFERTGFMDGDFVRFDYRRREISEAAICRQGVLDAGPLRGSVTIGDVESRVLAVLQNQAIGSPEYIELGKQVVRVLHTPLSRFVNVLRFYFGQYWLSPFPSWDSRNQTLGSYCTHSLHLKYSIDDLIVNQPFVPDEPISYAQVTGIVMGNKGFGQYILRSDWNSIGQLVDEGFEVSPSMGMLASARYLYQKENYRLAFVEAATALELAIGERLQSMANEDKVLIQAVQPFLGLPLRTQATVLANTLSGLSTDEVQKALKAIEIRNQLVHEGRDVSEAQRSLLKPLIRLIADIIPKPGLRFPERNSGNTVMSAEQWDA